MLMPGYNPDTDKVERNTDYHFTRGIELARVSRGTLRVVLPSVALVDPRPEEFLWQPMKALGVVDVWWSLHRPADVRSGLVECVYETADRCRFSKSVPRELVNDREAWESYRPYAFRQFLWAWQGQIDEREAAVSDKVTIDQGADSR